MLEAEQAVNDYPLAILFNDNPDPETSNEEWADKVYDYRRRKKKNRH